MKKTREPYDTLVLIEAVAAKGVLDRDEGLALRTIQVLATQVLDAHLLEEAGVAAVALAEGSDPA